MSTSKTSGATDGLLSQAYFDRIIILDDIFRCNLP